MISCTIDVSALIQAVSEDENGTLTEMIESAVDERLSDQIGRGCKRLLALQFRHIRYGE